MNIESMMQKAVEAFSDQVLAIRSGVVSANLIETIKVNYQDLLTPIKHMATVTESKGITVKPFDQHACSAIQKTIESAGHVCYTCKNVVIINIPKFCTSADKDRATIQVRKLEEDTKVVLRNIRKKARQQLTGSEDEIRKADKELQELTDKYVSMSTIIANNKISTF